jgi:succinate dehydrogenase/fumarate reductase cytochrome b subunit
MAVRTIHYYLMKTVRLSGWLLFVLVLGYILTGFSLCGKLGFSRVVDLQTALAIHKIFDWPLVAVFAVHSAATIYFALRRWGWIRTRTTSPRSHRRVPARTGGGQSEASPAVKP